MLLGNGLLMSLVLTYAGSYVYFHIRHRKLLPQSSRVKGSTLVGVSLVIFPSAFVHSKLIILTFFNLAAYQPQ